MGIVKSHGGHINFQPAPGGGAVFTVSLPLKSTVVEQTTTAANLT